MEQAWWDGGRQAVSCEGALLRAWGTGLCEKLHGHDSYAASVRSVPVWRLEWVGAGLVGYH